MDQFLQLLNPDLIQLQLLLLFLQNEELLLFLQPSLLKLGLDIVNFLLPAFLGLLAVPLQLVYLVLHLGYHFNRNYVGRGPFLGLLLALLYPHLHLLDLALFCDVLFVVLAQDSLILQQLFRQHFALLFELGQLLFEPGDFLFVLAIVAHNLEGLGLLLLDPEQPLLLALQGLELFLKCLELVLLALDAAAVVDVLELPLGEEYFVLELHDLNLLLLELHLLLLDGLVLFLVGVDAVLLLLLFLGQNFVHLFGQLVDLRLQLNILLDHLLPIGVVLLNLAPDLRLRRLFEIGLVLLQLLRGGFGWASRLHVEVYLLLPLFLDLAMEILLVVVVAELQIALLGHYFYSMLKLQFLQTHTPALQSNQHQCNSGQNIDTLGKWIKYIIQQFSIIKPSMCFGSDSKTKKNNQKQPKVLSKPVTKKAVKLVLCGNASVGKTSITMRYKDGKFTKLNEPTLAGAYQQKKIKTKNGEDMQLNIWDTAGDERFRSIMPLYYRDAEIALLVFDLTDAESFKGIDYWLGELESKVETEGILICIVGNKKDLVEERRVSKQQGMLKANENRALYVECSALSGEGVEELFQKVVEEHLKRKHKQ